MPVDTVSVRRVLSFQVLAVQVGIVTIFVPPSAFKPHRTRVRVLVVVLVFGAELRSKLSAGHRVTF